MTRRRLALVAAASAVLATAGPATQAAAQDAPIAIVATTGMIADAARQVGGDLVEVRGLMGPGVDPHIYRQTRSDIVALTRADLVLWHGLYLEAQMEGFLDDLARIVPVVAVAETLPPSLLREDQVYPGRFDPHIWMDPELWADVVTAIRDALIESRPEEATVFEANATAHLAALAELSAYARQVLSTVPADRRVLLTAHDAFAYFGDAFGYEVVGIQGISTESEAGVARVSELVDLLVDRGISAVFVETSVSDRNLRALIEGAGARGHGVAIGGELFSDAMGEDGSYEGTYIGMIDHNVTTIARALGGDAPEGGMLGRLGGGF